jgi:hypothetical protein
MNKRWFTQIMAVAVVLGGSTYLSATPARGAEAAYPCSNAGWSALIADASALCGGGASVVATCTGGKLMPEAIYCY